MRELPMETVKVLGKGQIVIPAAIRKKHGMVPGTEVQIFENGNLIVLMPPTEDPVQSAMGCLPGEPSLAEELIEARKRDFKP
jgi:AbrB family looped-hinge helix DNA binding protein